MAKFHPGFALLLLGSGVSGHLGMSMFERKAHTPVTESAGESGSAAQLCLAHFCNLFRLPNQFEVGCLFIAR